MGVRLFPGEKVRVETGPVQFGDDWPGVFIRGDNAFAFAMALEWVLNENSPADDIFAAQARGIIPLLRSCVVEPCS